jgi:drug/metabolite transporter (DMT)-like permease
MTERPSAPEGAAAAPANAAIAAGRSRLAGSGSSAVGLSGAGLLLLVTLSLAWGFNWPMMKLAVQEVPPWTFRTLCLMIGGTALLALTWSTGGRIAVPAGRLPRLALVSLFNITGWHLASAYALLYTGSGRAAIIGYTMPLWASLLSVLVLQARITRGQIMAMALGMAALALLLGDDLGALGTAPTGTLLMLLCAWSWAIGTVLIKRFDWGGMPVMALTGWQLLLGGVPVVIGWWLLEPVPDLTALSWPALLGLNYAIWVAMLFCHTAYFKLVSLLPAHVAAIGTLATPVVGVLSSALVLAEPIGAAETLALVLVVGGLFLLIRPFGR